jgi:hypothetical protein
MSLIRNQGTEHRAVSSGFFAALVRVVLKGKVAMPAKRATMESRTATRSDDNTFNGTRKLVRPHLPPVERRRDPVHTDDPLTHAMISDVHGTPESSHAEAFYFQKQMQQQTEMTVVIIQWYDRCTVKLRSGRTRILIFKAAIKYLYKTSEAHAGATVMK